MKKVEMERFGKLVNKGINGSAQLSPCGYCKGTFSKNHEFKRAMKTIPTMLKKSHMNALTSPLNMEFINMKLPMNTGDNCTKCLISSFILYKDRNGFIV
jgi:hypothetical protein